MLPPAYEGGTIHQYLGARFCGHNMPPHDDILEPRPQCPRLSLSLSLDPTQCPHHTCQSSLMTPWQLHPDQNRASTLPARFLNKSPILFRHASNLFSVISQTHPRYKSSLDGRILGSAGPVSTHLFLMTEKPTSSILFSLPIGFFLLLSPKRHVLETFEAPRAGKFHTLVHVSLPLFMTA